jgi:hypothetical protein
MSYFNGERIQLGDRVGLGDEDEDLVLIARKEGGD